MKQIHRQLLRGTSAELNALAGLEGQLVYDTTLDRLRYYDGVTVGGKLVPEVADVITTLASAAYPVGCLAFGEPVSAAVTYSRGGKMIGTDMLRATDAIGTNGTVLALTGEWTCLGHSTGGSATMWIRTA